MIVPSIVAGESQFYRDADGVKHAIVLGPAMQSGAITVYEAAALDLRATSATLHSELRDRIHAGELEALTYLRTHDLEGIAFVSGDGAAIEAAVAVDAAEYPLSGVGAAHVRHEQAA